MPRKSFRTRFEFWLDLEKPGHFSLAETIEQLKAQRAYSRTIRNGIRLITDLEAGNTDVLFELYPHLKEALTGELEDRLDRLESLLRNGQQHNHTPQQMSPGHGSPVTFDAADTTETQSTEDYVEAVFEDLEALGF